ncbi:VOC family protein [Ferrovibrio sp.]|uniref:bleomycin resistance protein n=1 Tax=Ferrovibrio sp. TaxID=1917215 RepID=UPI0025C0349A|nr:VOC family protein [Ferrovibrio sp.]MBX3454508.1 VOC family protein [Ferrovibrio sp.]
MSLLHAIPILPCRNLDRTQGFFAALGFALRGRYPDYLILSRNGQELHFALSETPEYTFDVAANCAGAYLRVADADALHAAWIGQTRLWQQDARIAGSVENKPWGQREFHFLDPDRNLFRIGQAITP